MRVHQLMRRRVESIGPGATAQDAAIQMRDAGVGSLVVIEDERPFGTVTERDLVLRVLACGAEPRSVAVRDVIARKPIFVGANREVRFALELMREQAIRRVPVVNDEQRLIGVLSLDDAIVSLTSDLACVSETIRRGL